MKAKEALRQSVELLICQEKADGLVTIFHEQPGNRVPAEPYHLRFTPRDADELFNSWGTVMTGSYNNLEQALRAAAGKYGANENDWQPITAEDLPKGGHGPPLPER